MLMVGWGRGGSGGKAWERTWFMAMGRGCKARAPRNNGAKLVWLLDI